MPDLSDCHVVLVPGLWMPAWVMVPLQRHAARAGFKTSRFGYASARADLTQNAECLARFIDAGRFARVHVVGHSLGGIVALHATARFALQAVHRIVMLGSPYGDCYAARELGRSGWGRRMLGRTVPDWLETAHLGIPSGVEVGVVAGTAAFGLGRIVVPNLPRPHDGVIRVEETAVEGMKDCALVPVSHSHMLLSGLVGRLVCRFLLDGCFESRAVLPEEARA